MDKANDRAGAARHEDIVETMSLVLAERYGDDALAIAERQAAAATEQPETWRAIIARLRVSA